MKESIKNYRRYAVERLQNTTWANSSEVAVDKAVSLGRRYQQMLIKSDKGG